MGKYPIIYWDTKNLLRWELQWARKIEKSGENLEENKNYEEIFFADIGNLEKVTANLLLPKFSVVMQ